MNKYQLEKHPSADKRYIPQIAYHIHNLELNEKMSWGIDNEESKIELKKLLKEVKETNL